MKPVKVEEPVMKALTEYVYGLSGPPDLDAALAAQGKTEFEERNCDTCHELDGTTEGEGPMLWKHGAAPWVRKLLQDPASPLFYGEKNDMPAYGKKLTAEELDSLSAFVAAQRDAK
jgi:ubiquinol-cytochrome c reductase cytochrome b subunit